MQITITASGDISGMNALTQEAVQKVFMQVISRGTRAANELRNAALDVLDNPSPSAPGNPPGARSHHLRKAWRPAVEGGGGGGGVSIRPTIYSGARYAGYLEDGTRKMAARPFRDKVVQQAEPRITAIYSEPYF